MPGCSSEVVAPGAGRGGTASSNPLCSANHAWRERPLYQPEMGDNLCCLEGSAAIPLNLGNLLLISLASNPASRLGRAGLEAAVSSSNSGRSSLFQRIG